MTTINVIASANNANNEDSAGNTAEDNSSTLSLIQHVLVAVSKGMWQ